VGRDDVRIVITNRKPSDSLAFARRGVVTAKQGLAGEPAYIQRWIAALAFLGLVLVSLGIPGRLSPAVESAVSGTVLAIGFGAAVGAMVLWLGVFRARERAADRLAHEWGYPLTQEVATRLDQREHWVRKTWFFRPFRSHDRPFDRVTVDSTNSQ